MKPIGFAAVLVLCAHAAQAGPRRSLSPEQHPGQLAQMRLALMYPVPVAETSHPPTSDPTRRLDDFIEDVGPVLRNVDGLTAYLREGLRDPRAVGESNAHWAQAWARLDREIERLKTLVAEGESIQLGPVAPRESYPVRRDGYRVLEEKPEAESPDWARLHRAAVLASYAANLREYLLSRSANASFERARASLGSGFSPLPN